MGNSFLKNIKRCKCGRFYKIKCNCNIVWNKGLTKETDKRIKKYAKKKEGKNNPMYGMKEELNPHWKGGIMKIEGYRYILNKSHPRTKKTGKYGQKYIPEHVLVMEKHLGRFLEKDEVVHHEDGNRSNNEIKNLILFKNNLEHLNFHRKRQNG